MHIGVKPLSYFNIFIVFAVIMAERLAINLDCNGSLADFGNFGVKTDLVAEKDGFMKGHGLDPDGDNAAPDGLPGAGSACQIHLR
jgi:hypothetical protein